MTCHLAQLNIGRLRAPLDSPQLADFVAALDEINALADRAPGFVWRLQTDDGDATTVRLYDDDRIIVTLSVWESAAHLHDYVYRGGHAAMMARRREWFDRLTEASLVLWWIPAGELPTPQMGADKLEHLRVHGPTQDAFTFRQLFGPPAPPFLSQL